jgi:phage-related protein
VQPLAVAKIDDAVEEHLNGRDSRDPPPEFPATSQIDGELRELRVRFARTRYRVLYQRSRNLMVLLHAFEKNTGSVPAGDRQKARKRMADFQARMDASPWRRPRAAGHDAPAAFLTTATSVKGTRQQRKARQRMIRHVGAQEHLGIRGPVRKATQT